MVALAAPHLAGHELARVVEDPADRRFAQLGDGLVLLGPGDRPLGGVDVRHLGPGLGRDQRGGPRVGEEIEDAGRLAAHLGQPLQHPLPVRQLLGEEAQVAEAGESAEHGDAQHLQRPGLGQRLVLVPAAGLAVLLAAAGLELGVRPQPRAGIERRLPHGLRLRAVDREAAEALELAAVAAVEQRVVGEARRGDHAQGGAGGVRPSGSDTLARTCTRRSDHLYPLAMVSDPEGLTPTSSNSSAISTRSENTPSTRIARRFRPSTANPTLR